MVLGPAAPYNRPGSFQQNADARAPPSPTEPESLTVGLGHPYFVKFPGGDSVQPGTGAAALEKEEEPSSGCLRLPAALQLWLRSCPASFPNPPRAGGQVATRWNTGPAEQV